jgi:hypothetical protein
MWAARDTESSKVVEYQRKATFPEGSVSPPSTALDTGDTTGQADNTALHNRAVTNRTIKALRTLLARDSGVANLPSTRAATGRSLSVVLAYCAHCLKR